MRRLDQWLETRWALAPSPCRKCKGPSSVMWWAKVPSADGPGNAGFWTWCPTCTPIDKVPYKYRDAAAFVGEIRQPLTEVLTGPDYVRGKRPPLAIWTWPGVPVDADELAAVVRSLGDLAHAREVYVRKPGEWTLAMRDDGSLWAPWCPINEHWRPRHGEPLPYRESRIGASRTPRICVTCLTPLVAGETVWRPYNPGSTVAMAGWPSDAHQRACVCHECARKVIAKVVETDAGRVCGPLRLVREPAEAGS